jgi:hypothetical protein
MGESAIVCIDSLSLVLPKMGESVFKLPPLLPGRDCWGVLKFPRTGESPLPVPLPLLVGELLNLKPSPLPKIPDLNEREGAGGDLDSGSSGGEFGFEFEPGTVA